MYKQLILVAVAVGSTLLVWWKVGLDTVRQNFDGPYYAVVAKSWYNPQIIRSNFSFPIPLEYYPAHFPLYPALMSVIDQFTGIGYLNAGLIINLLAAVGVTLLLYRITKQPWVGVAWLFLWPRIWADAPFHFLTASSLTNLLSSLIMFSNSVIL